MNQNRIHQLLEWLKAEPNDTFSLYALAMEYKSEMPQMAVSYLEKIRDLDANYTATYYHLAELYQVLGDRATAEKVYQEGINICKQQQAQHALAELQNAYQNFLYDD